MVCSLGRRFRDVLSMSYLRLLVILWGPFPFYRSFLENYGRHVFLELGGAALCEGHSFRVLPSDIIFEVLILESYHESQVNYCEFFAEARRHSSEYF
jgi:hypothetical protein